MPWRTFLADDEFHPNLGLTPAQCAPPSTGIPSFAISMPNTTPSSPPLIKSHVPATPRKPSKKRQSMMARRACKNHRRTGPRQTHRRHILRCHFPPTSPEPTPYTNVHSCSHSSTNSASQNTSPHIAPRNPPTLTLSPLFPPPTSRTFPATRFTRRTTPLQTLCRRFPPLFRRRGFPGQRRLGDSRHSRRPP